MIVNIVFEVENLLFSYSKSGLIPNMKNLVVINKFIGKLNAFARNHKNELLDDYRIYYLHYNKKCEYTDLLDEQNEKLKTLQNTKKKSDNKIISLTMYLIERYCYEMDVKDEYIKKKDNIVYCINDLYEKDEKLKTELASQEVKLNKYKEKYVTNCHDIETDVEIFEKRKKKLQELQKKFDNKKKRIQHILEKIEKLKEKEQFCDKKIRNNEKIIKKFENDLKHLAKHQDDLKTNFNNKIEIIENEIREIKTLAYFVNDLKKNLSERIGEKSITFVSDNYGFYEFPYHMIVGGMPKDTDKTYIFCCDETNFSSNGNLIINNSSELRDALNGIYEDLENMYSDKIRKELHLIDCLKYDLAKMYSNGHSFNITEQHDGEPINRYIKLAQQYPLGDFDTTNVQIIKYIFEKALGHGKPYMSDDIWAVHKAMAATDDLLFRSMLMKKIIDYKPFDDKKGVLSELNKKIRKSKNRIYGEYRPFYFTHVSTLDYDKKNRPKTENGTPLGAFFYEKERLKKIEEIVNIEDSILYMDVESCVKIVNDIDNNLICGSYDDCIHAIYERLCQFLTPKEKTIFDMHYVDNEKFEDIAKKIGEKADNVRKIASRAYNKLMKKNGPVFETIKEDLLTIYNSFESFKKPSEKRDEKTDEKRNILLQLPETKPKERKVWLCKYCCCVN